MKLGIGVLLFIFLVGCNKDEQNPLLSEEEHHQDVIRMVANFEQNPQIIIYYEPTEDSVQNEMASIHGIQSTDYVHKDNKYQYLSYQISELIKRLNSYPIAFMEKANLNYIYIVSSRTLHYSGMTITGYGTIALNNRRPETLDHELFHTFDPQINSIKWTNAVWDFDSAWRSLNPPNFNYGDGCGQDDRASTYTEGFITQYCRCLAVEDRAVTFQMIISENEVLLEKIKQDPYLNAKVEFMKNLLNDYGYNL